MLILVLVLSLSLASGISNELCHEFFWFLFVVVVIVVYSPSSKTSGQLVGIMTEILHEWFSKDIFF